MIDIAKIRAAALKAREATEELVTGTLADEDPELAAELEALANTADLIVDLCDEREPPADDDEA